MMLHVVGRLTEPVASFLGPSVEHLLALGIRQHVLLMTDAARPLAPDTVPHGVELTSIDAGSGPGWRAWAEWRRAYRRLAGSGVSAVHFHGVRPWLMGLLEGHAWVHQPALYLSPHGSRLLPLLPLALAAGRWRGLGVERTGTVGRDSRSIIATNGFEAQRLRQMGLRASASYPVVNARYLQLQRAESAQPCIVGGAHIATPAGADRFARLAVVLAGAAAQMRYQWLGPCNAVTRARLEAAGVTVIDTPDVEAALVPLREGWVFVATVLDPRTPLMLAQAMAAGLACIAVCTPTHLDLIDHERTGVPAEDDAALLAAICALIDDPARRRRLGDAARAETKQRFGRRQLARGLASSYGERLVGMASVPDSRPPETPEPADAGSFGR